MLAAPLNINVAELAQYFPEFRHRLPWDGETSEFLINDSNFKRSQFLCFDDKTPEGFTSLSSQYSSAELAKLLSRVPIHIAEPLKEALVGTELEIPNLTASTRSFFSAKPKRYTGILPEHVLLPPFNSGSKVLDMDI